MQRIVKLLSLAVLTAWVVLSAANPAPGSDRGLYQ